MTEVKDKKIIFFGTPEFAREVLNNLTINGYNIIAVICQPDRPVGRKKELKMPETKELALKKNISVFQPEKIDNTFINKIKALNPDIFITVAYGLMLPKQLLEIPKFGAINIHASLLPKYRGASPIPYAIMNGEKETGVSIIKMTDKLDAGPIILQKSINIESNDNSATLRAKLTKLSIELLLNILPNILNNKISLTIQDEKLVSYAPKLTRDNAKIDWNKSVGQIYNFIRAMNPWPTAWTTLNNTRLKIIKAEINETQSNNKNLGKIEITDNSLIILCQNGSIKIVELQLEGKNLQTSDQFINGHQDINNSILK